MYYEINVSLNGEHYFATSERSITNERTAKILAVDFNSRFPKKDGFLVTVQKVETIGRFVEFNGKTVAFDGPKVKLYR